MNSRYQGIGEQEQQVKAVEENPGDVDIQCRDWISFLDSFSRQHEDWLATSEISSPTSRQIEVKNGRFKGISIDHCNRERRLYVHVETTGRVTHIVAAPVRITLKQTQAEAHEGLEITSADGESTIVRFRSAMRPEMINGLRPEE
jgi:hypothetical protein